MARLLELLVFACIFVLPLTLADLHPKFISSFEKQNVRVQDTLTLNCSASGELPMNYTWYDTRQRKLSSNNEKIQIFDDYKGSIMSIENVTINDDGIYTCTAANEHGSASKLFQVTIDETRVNFRILQFHDAEVPIGGEALLECKAEGTPKPNMKFMKFDDYQDISTKEDYRIKVMERDEGDVRTLSLRIIDVRFSDDGFYVCRVWDNYSISDTRSHLQVQYSPGVIITPSSVILYPPKEVNITCFAAAIPNATLTWYFEQNKITRANYTIIGELSQSILTLKAKFSSQEVYGIYECVAHNALGINATEIEVKEGKVPKEISEIIIKSVTPSSVTFDFIGPPDEEELPIKLYSMTYKNLDRPGITLNINWKRGSIYKVKDLWPSTLYLFKVSAVNDVGDGIWKSIEYRTLSKGAPEPPEILTQREEVSSYPDKFTVWWLIPNDNGFPILYFNISYYKVERRFANWIRVNEKRNVTIRNWVGNPSVTLTKLNASTYYKVEISAVNQAGKSSSSSVIFKTNDIEITTKIRKYALLPIILSVVGAFVLYVIIDVISFFTCRCGLIHLMCRGKCKG